MKKILSIGLILLLFMVNAMPVMAEIVMYNTKTGKYHSLGCRWATQCTVNCIKIEKKQAIRHGGIPCKVCGG